MLAACYVKRGFFNIICTLISVSDRLAAPDYLMWLNGGDSSTIWSASELNTLRRNPDG